MIQSSLTYAERRRIREDLQRAEQEGESLDPAIKCRCPHCNQVHYKRKEPNDLQDIRKQENEDSAQRDSEKGRV